MNVRCPDCDGGAYIPCSHCGGDCEDENGAVCVHCEGRGDSDCERCHGTGEVNDSDLEDDEKETDDDQ